jgi:hypothetical protein
MAVAKIVEALKASGIDLPAMLHRPGTDGGPAGERQFAPRRPG